MANKRKNRFSLDPFYFNSKVRLMGVDFGVIKGEDIYHPRNPVFDTMPNQTFDYGRLFTYALSDDLDYLIRGMTATRI